ncbi:unnamed protein product [Callosobruchus maculatus]|uniref:Uncharacterized protein n=1 Tax=Callosobruchus maculatus TaxID=64391 RepID=A0A653CG32_CALMS|nr:unnamed protein product [Callosobruchus maculatus]
MVATTLSWRISGPLPVSWPYWGSACILRYEIREMIQKIRLLRSELELPNANGAVPSCLIQHAPASGGGGLLRHANEMRAAAAAAAAAAANTQTMYRETGGGTVANEAGDSEHRKVQRQHCRHLLHSLCSR